MSSDQIWVLVEVTDGKATQASLELLSAAKSLSSAVVAVTYNADAEALATVLGSYGATKIYSVGELEGSLAGPKVADIIAKVVAEEGAPRAILFAQTYDGRDVLARLSVKLDLPVLTNVVNIVEREGDLVSEHAIFGGEQIVTAGFTHNGPKLFAVRAKSFVAEESGGGAAEVHSVPGIPAGASDGAKVKSSHVEEHAGPKLDEAAVVVSGGRGLGSAANYAMVEELAQLLRGAPGASRAIVDAGWVPYSYQVGQTGKTVKPTLYFAVGISGATQHMVGMKGAKNIIAVNKDKEAPIFQIADLGIVGDAHKVIPKLIEALRQRR